MKIKNTPKSRKNKYVTIAFILVIVVSLFFHVNVTAQPHQQQDSHSAHHNSSFCTYNICCMSINFNHSILELRILSSHLFNSPLSVTLNGKLDLPYKPPKR